MRKKSKEPIIGQYLHEIRTKLNVGQKVYYLRGGQIDSGIIVNMEFCFKENRYHSTLKVYYYTDNGIFIEEEKVGIYFFATKEELIKRVLNSTNHE